MQESQPSPHSVLQHTPSAQNPETHWLADAQGMPLSNLSRQPASPLQKFPLAQCWSTLQLPRQTSLSSSQAYRPHD